MEQAGRAWSAPWTAWTKPYPDRADLGWTCLARKYSEGGWIMLVVSGNGRTPVEMRASAGEDWPVRDERHRAPYSDISSFLG